MMKGWSSGNRWGVGGWDEVRVGTRGLVCHGKDLVFIRMTSGGL